MRKAASWLHRYLGLALAGLLLVSGGTGAFITFSSEIDAAFNPSLRQVEAQPEAVSIDTLAAGAREARPRDTIRLIVLPTAPGDAAEAWYAGSRMRAYLDPYSGQILGVRDTHDSLLGFLTDLHINLIAGDIGKAVLGWAGLATIVLIGLGTWLWWPKPGRWQQAFKIKWGASPVRVWFDVHKLAGVLVGAFLVVIATTGSALALYDVVTQPLLATLTGKGPSTAPPVSSRNAGEAASLDTMVMQAKATFPEGRVTRIVMPAHPQAAVAVRMQLPGEAHQLGRTFVFFDQYNGKLLRADNIFQANAAARIYSWLYPLHTGYYGGTVTRAMNILFGMSLSLLAISGCWIWMRNKFVKRRADLRKRIVIRSNKVAN
ncbi:PepSY-associated TM helix domain-containing protein [Azohydromonas australica]|uniref:PepSY-associated TM helix domain-containing protein n=1 Tax=Azohydromonas australica TaxID=364039 RepID=UPI000407C22B|nr:PepSY-associated TM helix domain-containing protein [Azohydromonas australica]